MVIQHLDQKILEELLEQACPSIKHRLRRDILGQSTDDDEMICLQEQILEDPAVRDVFGWQQPDGWLAWNFHGTSSIEAGIRLLCEKGINTSHPVLEHAIQALRQYPDRQDRGLGRPGRILDDLGLGGSKMIQATLFACAGFQDEPCVKDQVNEALAGFKAVLAVNRITDIAMEYRGCLVFKPEVRWPGIYHLRLLAFTHHWRTPENLQMLVEAIRHLVALSPIPDIHARSQGQLIAPASFCMHTFTPELETLNAAGWMMWFHRMECLSKLGMIPHIPEFESQLEQMPDLAGMEPAALKKKFNHPYFTKWGAYTGIMLEPDWHNPKNVFYDLSFRCLLIHHYYGP